MLYWLKKLTHKHNRHEMCELHAMLFIMRTSWICNHGQWTTHERCFIFKHTNFQLYLFLPIFVFWMISVMPYNNLIEMRRSFNSQNGNLLLLSVSFIFNACSVVTWSHQVITDHFNRNLKSEIYNCNINTRKYRGKKLFLY